jgi:membrane-associated phospholipid phosphatase
VAEMKMMMLRLTTNDRLFLSLNLLFGILALLSLGRANDGYAGISMAGQLLFAALLLGSIPAAMGLIRLTDGGSSLFLGWLRTFYGQLMYILYFSQVIALSRLFHGGASFDALIAGFEERLFGFRPVMAVFETLPKLPWLNELFFFGYFSFYIFLAAPWWILYFKGEKGRAAVSMFTITASFGLLYLWYLFFPVTGPKLYYPELQTLWYTPFDGWFFVPLLKSLFTPATMAGAAFPSSHVAIGLVSLLLNFRYNRPLAWWLLPLYALLCASTVWLYTHYVVDIFAGWIAGGVLFLLIPRLASRFTRLEYPE